MKITGEIKPVTHTNYQYTLITNAGKTVTVHEWEIHHKGKSLQKNTSGIFKFGTTLAGQSITLIAKTKQNGKYVPFSVTLNILAGTPKILSLEWKDNYDRVISKGTKVGYTDIVKLVIKTINIPVGDTLSVTIFEDEYTDGHGDTSRKMDTYKTSPINKNGVAFITFNNIKVYQTYLNGKDYKDESEHEFYAVVQYRSHIKRIMDQIQLVIQNEGVSYIKPPVTNKPVVVAAPKINFEKKDKQKINVTFNMFFDGTMNNMANTSERIEKSGVYDDKSNKEDDSYTNFYSNVALLYMNNNVKENEDIIKIYTEGIGTADKKQDQAFPGGALGTSLAIYMRGIKEKVFRGLHQMGEFANAKYFAQNKEIDKVTINVFGFSRGAAAARYFLSQESLMMVKLKLKSKKNINFNFIGLFDTVASHGIVHINDVADLQLNLKGKPKKVVQLAADDEYRSNFKLTNIKSSIDAGVGYELKMPGAHSDIGGGYNEILDEERILKEDGVFENYSLNNRAKIEKEHLTLKNKYIKEGWYNPNQIFSKKVGVQNAGSGKSFYKLQLIGIRKGLKNTYQYIPFSIMKKFAEKYAVMDFYNTTDILYNVNQELHSIKKQLYDYAIKNDGINSLTVTLSHNDLIIVRNKYLHRSNQDTSFTMAGRYDDNGNPDRDILEG